MKWRMTSRRVSNRLRVFRAFQTNRYLIHCRMILTISTSLLLHSSQEVPTVSNVWGRLAGSFGGLRSTIILRSVVDKRASDPQIQIYHLLHRGSMQLPNLSANYLATSPRSQSTEYYFESPAFVPLQMFVTMFVY